VRYARPHCDECVRLAAESSELALRRNAASEELRMTPKNDRTYVERRKREEKLIGQWREALKREDLHEKTHQDEYSD
jgi:hypothetical protein